ncbi:maltokinase N-terminal cap-like domain-containing protein [Janibacter alittae]|uniref:Maltokinase n=1 Tax=Janibacter alittae TaxID=3115209 RepID=A0ABZ2MJQ5_9MICO
MATIHDAALSPGKVELVAGWIGAQRWYTGTGRPHLRRLDSWRLDDPAGEVGIETIVLLDESDSVVYQVPLTYRGAPLEGGTAALLGEMDHSVLGRRWVYDAPHDPVYVEQLLRLVRGRVVAQHGSQSDTPEPDVRGVPHPTWPTDPVVGSSRVHGGEQSNTSVIVDATPSPVVIKIFRTLAAGDNPDITLQEALAKAQSPFVPSSIGHVDGAWTRPDGDGRDHGQIAFAQEYLADTTDAWQVGLEQAASGTPFADRARELGRVTAQVHSTLAKALPTRAADAATVREHVGRMRRRAGVALGEVPALAAHERPINRLLRAAERADWPALQRIHGDLHLGQVLDSPRRGWVLIDFEGEPLRPLSERNALDSPLRDVAGLLRSIDYVAGSLTRPGAHTAADVDVRRWCTRAQEAFLDGYGEIDTDPREHETLLTAFVLDKALYEVIYEARNRPSWLPLPLEAIDRLLQEAHP